MKIQIQNSPAVLEDKTNCTRLMQWPPICNIKTQCLRGLAKSCNITNKFQN